ncbi:MAG: hypothetical protein CR975_04565 [Gammaproteobacteria bacterium]|nr:MAG: hypothetical protein CR975_04565 [Gammaproteobacteria bacterium]
MSQKIGLLIGLCIGFAIALWLLQGLVIEREGFFRQVVTVNSHQNIIDDYRLVLRSVKYGMLFIVLTFAVFFLFEVLQDLRIHPVQYLLVGAALWIFYLLLLSFSEQISFVAAYWIAVVACVGLITWYVRYVLKTDKRAWIMGSFLMTGYTIMFVLLHSTTYTLLIGSVLLFIALAGVMWLTRNIDWYSYSAK